MLNLRSHKRTGRIKNVFLWNIYFLSYLFKGSMILFFFFLVRETVCVFIRCTFSSQFDFLHLMHYAMVLNFIRKGTVKTPQYSWGFCNNAMGNQTSVLAWAQPMYYETLLQQIFFLHISNNSVLTNVSRPGVIHSFRETNSVCNMANGLA